MKIVGIFLILICLGLNAFIGFILYSKAYLQDDNKSNNIVQEQVKVESEQLKEHKYTSHGFSFSVSSIFISDKNDMKKDMIDYLYTNDTSDNYSPSIQVYYYAEKQDINVDDSQKYIDYYGKPSSDNEYMDGGVIYSKNGEKMYYDVIKEKSNNSAKGLIKKMKIYSFYYKNNAYSIVFKDDELSFDKNVAEFDDKIITTLSLF